jgi:hypothetical protein
MEASYALKLQYLRTLLNWLLLETVYTKSTTNTTLSM